MPSYEQNRKEWRKKRILREFRKEKVEGRPPRKGNAQTRRRGSTSLIQAFRSATTRTQYTPGAGRNTMNQRGQRL